MEILANIIVIQLYKCIVNKNLFILKLNNLVIRQIDGKTMETVTDFIFRGLK